MATGFNTQVSNGEYRLQFETDNREYYMLMQETARSRVDGKPVTNADRIRAMSDEELADMLWKTGRNYRAVCADPVVDYNEHRDNLIAWLKQPPKIDIADIAKAPTIEAEPVKHGRWEWDTEDIYRCTVCYEKVHVKEVMGRPDWDYCPNCGARMDGDENG